MKAKRVVALLTLLSALSVSLVGCTEADQVSQNISKEADNFNVCRRITVINVRSGEVLYEFEGFSSLKTDTGDNQLEITSEVGDGVYKKDFIYLNKWITYVAQDISGANVDPYHYEWNILPEFGVKVTHSK